MAEPYLLECVLDKAEILRRLLEREKKGGSVSDGRAELLPSQMDNFEPITEIDKKHHIRLKTDQSIERLAEHLLRDESFKVPLALFFEP